MGLRVLFLAMQPIFCEPPAVMSKASEVYSYMRQNIPYKNKQNLKIGHGEVQMVVLQEVFIFRWMECSRSAT